METIGKLKSSQVKNRSTTVDWGEDTIREILSSRAKKLAQRDVTTNDSSQSYKILSLSLGLKEKYAVDIEQISQIVKIEQWTSVPGSATQILGVININGIFHCLADLVQLLGLEQQATASEGYGLVLKKTRTCLMITAPEKISEVSPDDFVIISQREQNPISQHAKAIALGDIIVLDIERIMAHPALTRNNKA